MGASSEINDYNKRSLTYWSMKYHVNLSIYFSNMGQSYTIDFNLEIIKTIGLQNIKFYALKVCLLGYSEFKHLVLGHCIS